MRAGRKLLVFAHHHEVLDGLQEAAHAHMCARAPSGVDPDILVKIDGRTSAADKDAAVRAFQGLEACRLALLGIQAAGVRALLPLHLSWHQPACRADAGKLSMSRVFAWM